MNFKSHLISSLKITLGSSELLDLMEEFINIINNLDDNSSTSTTEITETLFLFKAWAQSTSQTHDRYYELIIKILCCYLDLEVKNNNPNVMDRIYTTLHRFLDDKNNIEFDVIRTFMMYFIQDLRKVQQIKEDASLISLFTKLFEKQFLQNSNKLNGTELRFYTYLFIYKIWYCISSTDAEKEIIEHLIPDLCNFEVPLSFNETKKYLVAAFYNDDISLNYIQRKILQLTSNYMEMEPAIDNQIIVDRLDCTQLPWLNNIVPVPSNHDRVVNTYQKIHIIERFKYQSRSRNKLSLAQYRKSLLKARKLRNKNLIRSNKLIQGVAKVKRLDPFELEAFKNEKLPLKYMEVMYSTS